MKLVIVVIRIIVGLLFIFSGLVKANDPLGLSYKMQEFFEVWGVHGFNHTTLTSSILMNAFEIIAGFALLIGWRIRLFSWLLLLLILFFTFLTGYTYVTGKPTNCGCFGDCLPITSQTSFLKDVVLTVLIGILFFYRNKIKPLFSNKLSVVLMLLVTLFSFGLQWYALRYQPVVDCLPYKKGNSIPEKMKSPIGSVPDSFAIRFVYEKGGKEFEFAPDQLPNDLDSYNYVSRTDKLIRKGNAEPPIKGFVLTGITSADSTTVVLEQQNAVLLFCETIDNDFSSWKNEFVTIAEIAQQKNIPVYVITSQRENTLQQLAAAGLDYLQVFTCDYTAIRTAARTNPSLYLLEKGSVLEKQGKHRWDLVKNKLNSLASLPAPIPVQVTDTVTVDTIP